VFWVTGYVRCCNDILVFISDQTFPDSDLRVFSVATDFVIRGCILWLNVEVPNRWGLSPFHVSLFTFPVSQIRALRSEALQTSLY